VKVTDTKSSGEVGVKLAYLTDNILPGKNTVKTARTKAFDFVGKYRSLAELEKVAEENQDITLNRTQEIKRSDYNILGLGSGTPTRNFVKWLFKAKTGEVSSEIYTYQDQALFYDSKFVVAAMVSKQTKGLPATADIRAEVEPLVKNQKKAEKIIAKIKAGDNLDAVAAANQASVQEASGVSFSQSFVQGMGNEPKVIGQIFNLELNKVSSPIIGKDAVFVIEPVYKSEANTLTDYAEIKKGQSSQTKTSITQGLFEAMKKKAKLKDNRTRFY
jgi:peptidyl-prolyl cis-trans isomerase D